jgi:hypothetical protein
MKKRKISRNEKCPCGSGKKYKKCCMNKTSNKQSSHGQTGTQTIFEKYNTADLLKTGAALSVLPENHGKNIRLELFSRLALDHFNDNDQTAPFAELKAQLASSFNGHQDDDPVVSPFTELITFYGGDYLILPGITEGGSYMLSMLLTAVYNWPESQIPNQYRTNCKHGSLFLLRTSNHLAHHLGMHRYAPGRGADQEIYLPEEAKLGELKAAVTLTEPDWQLLSKGISPNAIERFLLRESDVHEVEEAERQTLLLTKPIIHTRDGYIVASPATLSYALTQFLIQEARNWGCLNQVSAAYHNCAWNEAKRYLFQMGFKAHDVSEIIELEPSEPLRESVFRFDDDKLAFVQYVAVVGEGTASRKQQVVNTLKTNADYAEYTFLDITLLSPLERENQFAPMMKTAGSTSLYFPIHDFEILAMLDDVDALDLWKFSIAREVQLDWLPLIGLSTLDLFQYYKEHHSSFYDTREGIMPQFAGSSELYIQAKQLKDRHSAPRYEDGRTPFIPVERKGKYAPVYVVPSNLGQELQFLVEGCPQSIWIKPTRAPQEIRPGARGIYFEMTDAIAYWLWQLSPRIVDHLKELGTDPITVAFDLFPEEKFDPIERNFNRDGVIFQEFQVEVEDHEIHLTIPASIIPYLYGPDNEGERILLRKMLDGLNALLVSNSNPAIGSNELDVIVEESAPLGPKKKIFILDTSDNMLLDPSNLGEARYIQDYDVGVVLDSFVPGLGKHNPGVGELTTKEGKTKLTRDIVMRVLLPRLKRTINQFDHEQLLTTLISLNEALIQKREDLRVKTPTRIACFVSEEEQTKDLSEALGKLNTTSIAARCLIEHLAAEPSPGNKEVSEASIDELIAIMSEIVDWGSLGDQLEYDLYEIRLGILKSGRVATGKNFQNEVLHPYFQSKTGEGVRNATEAFDQVFPQLLNITGKEMPEVLDNAFSAEFGISLTRICEFIHDMGVIAYQLPTPFAKMKASVLFAKVRQMENHFSREEFDLAIKYLALTQRESVEQVPEGFDPFDISPWRFSRRLSLVRRPVVAVTNPENPNDPILYWGFRHLLQSRTNIQEQCETHRFKSSEGGPLKKALGKISKERGVKLATGILSELDSETLIIDTEVFPHKHLNHDKDIGDVDVLVIDKETKTIYSLECKYRAPSRNIKEMVEEVVKLFGSGSKKGDIKKHFERHQWLGKNLDQIATKYSIDIDGFSVKSAIVIDEDLIPPHLKSRTSDLPFVTLSELKAKGLAALFV